MPGTWRSRKEALDPKRPYVPIIVETREKPVLTRKESRRNAHFNRLFQALTRESGPEAPIALWCRRCCTVVIRDTHHSLTQAGYAHLLDHERSAALMRLKTMNAL